MKVYIRQEFDSYDEAYAWGMAYLNAYHPMGYETRLDDPVEEDGKWVVNGSRYASCD
jgi:hypothetical protein